MSQRAPYDAFSATFGREAETRFDHWLTKHGIPHTWMNEVKESSDVDFILHLEGTDVQVECERKLPQYAERYREIGLDFLANKCDKYPNDTWYVLDVGPGFYAETMKRLLQYGARVSKPTRRGPIEEFIRIPGKVLFYCDYHGEKDPKIFLP